jgi:tRNA threonylcarbamoyladenosine biosynthesis protein TsaE
MAEVFTTRSVKGTLDLGRKLAERFGVGDCIALHGQLGSGKTVLVRGLAFGLGVTDEHAVSSPTFVLVAEYAGRIPIYHVDLYRLDKAVAELESLGLGEMLQSGLVLIEWAERAADLPRPHWAVTITATGPRSRRFVLERVP